MHAHPLAAASETEEMAKKYFETHSPVKSKKKSCNVDCVLGVVNSIKLAHGGHFSTDFRSKVTDLPSISHFALNLELLNSL